MNSKWPENSLFLLQIICGGHYIFAICDKIYSWGTNYDGLENCNSKEWEFFEEIRIHKLEWKEIRFLSIVFYKEDKKTCSFQNLQKI